MKLLCTPSRHHCRKIQSRFPQSLVISSASRARARLSKRSPKDDPPDMELTFSPCLKNSTKIVGKLRTLIRQTLLQIELARIRIFNQNLDSLTLHFNQFYLIPILRRRHEEPTRRQRPCELTSSTTRSRHDAKHRVDRHTAESIGIVSRQCSPNPDNLISSALVPLGRCSVTLILIMHPSLNPAGSAVSQSAFCIAVILYFSVDLTVALQLSPFAH